MFSTSSRLYTFFNLYRVFQTSLPHTSAVAIPFSASLVIVLPLVSLLVYLQSSLPSCPIISPAFLPIFPSHPNIFPQSISPSSDHLHCLLTVLRTPLEWTAGLRQDGKHTATDTHTATFKTLLQTHFLE